MAKVNKKKVALGVGLGLAAAAAAGAGYYFYGSKGAKAHRSKAAKWATDLKKDVVRGAKKAKKLDEAAYKALVVEAKKAYHNISSIDRKDLDQAAAELAGNWNAMKREIGRVAKKETKVVARVAQKTAKKVKHVIPRRPATKKATKKKKQ